jgi:hypothetical protein
MLLKQAKIPYLSISLEKNSNFRTSLLNKIDIVNIEVATNSTRDEGEISR